MGCGETGLLEGGILKDSTILGGNITQSAISDSRIDGAEITNLRSIDGSSAAKIAEALAALPDAQLADLAAAILAKMSIVVSTKHPVSTQADSLPTKMLGASRSGTLGEPAGWIEFGGKIVPAYDPEA